jgi:FkbM family methyltransferase
MGLIGRSLRAAKRRARSDRDKVRRFGLVGPLPASASHPVITKLSQAIAAADRSRELVDNVDPIRFPMGYEGPPPEEAPRRLAQLLEVGSGLAALYDSLDHEADRELLVRVLAFRVLGPRWIQMPMTLETLRERVAALDAARVAERTAPIGVFDWYADDYDLTDRGYPIVLRSHVGAVVQTFEFEQYRYPGEPEIAARPGDVVIDGGGCSGDTALYFAHRVGQQGRVVSYEFGASNLEIFRYNLGVNRQLADRIAVVPSALWDRAGETVSVRLCGPGTAVVPDGHASASTDTIDALVSRREVERVDFIKLDIEGAELTALRGAEATLRRFRPRLAIAAYHKPDDLAVLPAYLNSLELGYRFRLGHTTMHDEETVLFAAPPADLGSRAS